MLTDALDQFAVTAGDSYVELDVASSDRWLWYFGTPDVQRMAIDWDKRLISDLTGALGEDVLRFEIVDQIALGNFQPDDLGLRRTLTEPQHRDVSRMISLNGGANFSVPGAGKTTMALAAYAGLKHRNLVEQCLVVAPLSAHEAWTTEPREVFHGSHLPSVSTRPDRFTDEVIVVNYEWIEQAQRRSQVLAWMRLQRTLVIFDEAHRAKRGDAGVRGAAALEVSRHAAERMVLTGTPRPNADRDLENVLELAYPGRGPQLAQGRDLARAYCRVTKAELGLPPLRIVVERIAMSQAHDRVYGAMVDAAARSLVQDPALRQDLARVGGIYMLLLQAATNPVAVLEIAQHSLEMIEAELEIGLDELIRSLPSSFVPTKYVRLLRHVNSHREAGRKVLIWVGFRSHISDLRHLLKEHNPAFVYGAIPTPDRSEEIGRFRNDPNCSVLVATPHTLSEGISLHRTTTHQIHLDRGFNAGMYLQSLDRTHRLGLPTGTDCSATLFVAERRSGQDSIDNIVSSRLDQKVRAMSVVLDDPGLGRLALPDSDQTLGDEDVFLTERSQGDLAALFAHLTLADPEESLT